MATSCKNQKRRCVCGKCDSMVEAIKRAAQEAGMTVHEVHMGGGGSGACGPAECGGAAGAATSEGGRPAAPAFKGQMNVADYLTARVMGVGLVQCQAMGIGQTMTRVLEVANGRPGPPLVCNVGADTTLQRLEAAAVELLLLQQKAKLEGLAVDDGLIRCIMASMNTL